MKSTLIFLLLFLLSLNVFGQTGDSYSIERIQDSINRQLELFPQEKIHLHLDRDYYIPGEKIWFKAYVADAQTHQHPTHSRYVYVEMINSSDSLIGRVMIMQGEDGLFHGNLPIIEAIPEGHYTIRAYTRYMENRGDDYLFRKNVRIGKLSIAKDTKKRRENKKQSKADYDVSFFPEGGNLLEEAFNKVAFKALNEDGSSETISGELVDADGNLLCSVKTEHAGMGLFSFIPESGNTYFLKCKNSKGKEKRFKLPEACETYSITTSYRNRNHFISVTKPLGFVEKPLYLLVHGGGITYYFKAWDWEYNVITFSGDVCPSGILQAVLFDEEMNPLSERLIFNKNKDQATLAYSTDKPRYEKRDRIVSELFVTDKEGMPLTGHVSVAVTDDRDIAADTLTTIASSLLLSSELRGHIESPAYYLQDCREAEIALDLLMMTHGWRRYNIPEAIKGCYERPNVLFEDTKKISGKVRSLILEKPIVDGDVLVFSFSGMTGSVKTDAAGSFCFLGFDYPDSTHFFVQAKNRKGGERVELLVDEDKYPTLKYSSENIPFAAAETEEEDGFMKKAERRAQYDEDIRMIHLNEVEVVAKVIEKKDERRLKYWANSSSDNTIYREEIEKRATNNVTHLLYGVAGVRIMANGQIQIRGVGSLNSSTDPLVLIDGMPVEWPEELNSIYESPLEMVSIHDVECIDVFKGSNAAIFGMRGANGVISITTRGGSSSGVEKKSFNYASIAPLGYQSPVEFYSPKYDTPTAKNLSNPDYRTTLFWKPDVIFSEEGKASFEFYSSDFPTTYSVVIEGLSADGKIIRQVEKIIVE